MARQKKSSGRPYRGPWTCSQMLAALRANGWEVRSQKGSHLHLRHPGRRGKITLDDNWTSVKAGSLPFRGLREQGGYASDELIAILNGGLVDG